MECFKTDDNQEDLVNTSVNSDDTDFLVSTNVNNYSVGTEIDGNEMPHFYDHCDGQLKNLTVVKDNTVGRLKLVGIEKSCLGEDDCQNALMESMNDKEIEEFGMKFSVKDLHVIFTWCRIVLLET